MADALHKVVAWILSPLGIFFSLLVLAAVLRAFRRRRAAVLTGVAACVFLWTMGCPVATRLLGVPLEGEEFAPDAGGADVIVLLGGGMLLHEECGRADMNAAADRVWTAARLWRPGLKITVSGGGASDSTVPLLRDLGVDESCIVAFEDALNTDDEARLIRALGAKRIALVTSAWHMPRAKMLFERRGFDVIPCPTDWEMHGVVESPFRFRDLFPSADVLAANSRATKEWIARACYALVPGGRGRTPPPAAGETAAEP